MVGVVLGLGSNVGDSSKAIQEALDRLNSILELHSVSSLYESAPMYQVHQSLFKNAVAIAQVGLGPVELLGGLKSIEIAMGRVKRHRNDPREIDIDIVAYGALKYRFFTGDELSLQIPHPRLAERRFVLLPLAEIAPQLVIPGQGKVIDLLSLTESQAEDVRRVKDEVLSIHG